MMFYFEYAVTWLFFMAIIVGLCLITPKLAKKIDQWREAKKKNMRDGEEALPEPDSSTESEDNSK